MAGKHKKKKPPIDPQDVLTGKISLSPLELTRMIHRVNPTIDGALSEEAVERYKLKAKLQSLLIRLHSQGLRVEQTNPDQPQLIGLKLRHFSEDACHAFIQMLDEDARSWAQRQIDEGSFDSVPDSSPDSGLSASHFSSFQDQSPPATETIEKMTPEELLDAGRKALEEYDYERCELYYRRAFEASQGNVESVLSLLDLWVNNLAVYEKALGFSKSLSRQLKKDKNVRILIGLACVHSNHIDDALAWIENLFDPEVAEIYSLCVEHFIKQLDNTRASEILLLLKSCQSGSFTPRIVELENAVRALHAKSFEPLEDEMTQAWHADDFEKAFLLAIKLSSLLPENKAAQKILNEKKRLKQRRNIDRLLHLADEAKRQGNAINEADLLGQAVTAGEESDILKQRLENLRQEIRRKQEKMEVEKVIELLVQKDQTDGFFAYTELKPHQREHIQSRLKDPHLIWIEQALAAEISVKTEKIVTAVKVLGKSKEALEKGDNPQHVFNQIQHHYKALQSIPLTRQIMQQAEMLIRTQERFKNAELIVKARDALAGNNLKLTRELLEQIKVTRLEHDDKSRYDEINGKLNKLEGIKILGQKYEECSKREDHIAAREIAARFVTLTQGANAASWREKIEHHSACIKREWRLASADIEELPVCYGVLGLKDLRDFQKNGLLLDGRHFLFANGYGRWIFLKTFCLDDQQFKKLYILRSPKPISYISINQLGNSIWITSADCYLIEVSMNPFDIVFGKDYSDFIGDGWMCEDEWLFPKSRSLWLYKRETDGDREEIIEIIPIDQQRSTRQIKFTNSNFPVIINAGGECRIAIGEWKGRAVRIYSEGGKLVATYTLETSGVLDAAALHPNGSDIVFMPYDETESINTEEDRESGGDFLLTLEVKPDVEGNHKPIKISDTHGEFYHSMCTSLDAGIVYTYFEDRSTLDHNYHLAAWKPSEKGLTMLYRVPAPRNFFFACDERSMKAAAVQFSDMKITSVVLDEHPPAFELDSGIIAGKTDIPIIPERWMCSSPTGALKAEALALMLQMKKNPLKESRRVISEMKQTAHPDKIAVLACALELMFDYEESKNIGLWMKEAHPTHYTVKLKLAEEAATGADWPCVITTLDGITLEGIDDGTARHLCHLLGIAYFVEGDVKTALRTWHKGLEYADGECDLTSYIKFAELTLLSPQQRKEFEAENKLAKKLNLMEEIDRHASNMNWTAVINLFETEYTMENADVQTLSRLVHAYLNMNYEPGDVRWISKLIVMAHYCARFKDSYRAEYLLPPCIEKWSTTRLNDIFINAEQWLETMQSFPLSHPALRGIQREGRPS